MFAGRGRPVRLVALHVLGLSLAVRCAAQATGFLDPARAGGAWLTGWSDAPGEPLNAVVIAGSQIPLSVEDVEDWMTSAGYAVQCLGLHPGEKQQADLGDGRGKLPDIVCFLLTNLRRTEPERQLYRWAYGAPMHGGACYESLQGGSHIRYWPQQGTGAVFLAVSDEHNITNWHSIVENGYDLGRDHLVGNATAHGPTTSPVTGRVFNTSVTCQAGYLPVGSENINHNVAIDGQVAILKVTILEDWPTSIKLASVLCACLQWSLHRSPTSTLAAALILAGYIAALCLASGVILWALWPRARSKVGRAHSRDRACTHEGAKDAHDAFKGLQDAFRRHRAFEQAVLELRQRTVAGH